MPPIPGATQDLVKRVTAVGGQIVVVAYGDGQAQAEPWLAVVDREHTSTGPATVPQGYCGC